MPISEFFHMTVKGWGDILNWKHITPSESVSSTRDLMRARGGYSTHGEDKHLEWFKSDSSYSGVMNMINHCETCLLTGADFNINPDTGMTWNNDELIRKFGITMENWGQIVSKNPDVFASRQWPKPMQKVIDDSKIDLNQAYQGMQLEAPDFRVRMLSSGKDVTGNDMFTSLHAKNLFMELQGWLQNKFKDTLDFAFDQKPVYLRGDAGEIQYLSGHVPVGLVPDEAGEIPSGSIRDSIYQAHKDSKGLDITEQYRLSAQNKLNERCGSGDAISYWFNKHLNKVGSSGMSTQDLLGAGMKHEFHLPDAPVEPRTRYDTGGAIRYTSARPLKKLLDLNLAEEGQLLPKID